MQLIAIVSFTCFCEFFFFLKKKKKKDVNYVTNRNRAEQWIMYQYRHQIYLSSGYSELKMNHSLTNRNSRINFRGIEALVLRGSRNFRRLETQLLSSHYLPFR